MDTHFLPTEMKDVSCMVDGRNLAITTYIVAGCFVNSVAGPQGFEHRALSIHSLR